MTTMITTAQHEALVSGGLTNHCLHHHDVCTHCGACRDCQSGCQCEDDTDCDCGGCDPYTPVDTE